MLSVRIVLVATSHPGNIGSTARAMKTMGLTNLYLVNPRAFPDKKAIELAAGADDVLEQAQVVDSLKDALVGCHLVFATSARERSLGLPGVSPAECAVLVSQQATATQIAIVFGREHAGLTNEELLHAHYHVTIPSNPLYSSLNLSQAVQIIAYELRVHAIRSQAPSQKPPVRLATAEELEKFYIHLNEVMTRIQFLKTNRPTRRLIQRIRRLFNRSALEYTELTILRGFLTHIERKLELKSAIMEIESRK